MKRNLVIGSLATLILAGCGAGLIKIPIDNPVGLAGQQTTLSLRASSQAVATIPDQTATFADIDRDIPLTPSGFEYTLAIENVAFGSGCPTPVPSTVDVSIPFFKVTVSDSSGSSSGQVTNLKFTITKEGSLYKASKINGSLSFSDIKKLMSIIRKGSTNTPNSAVLTFSDPANPSAGSIITSSTPDLGNCSMTITWGGGTGTVVF